MLVGQAEELHRDRADIASLTNLLDRVCGPAIRTDVETIDAAAAARTGHDNAATTSAAATSAASATRTSRSTGRRKRTASRNGTG